MTATDDIGRPTVGATTAGGAVALALVLGLGSGFAAAGRPVVQTPQACHEMASRATDVFEMQTKLLGVVRERGDALDKETYRVLDAEVNHLVAALEAEAPKYNEAEAACLEVAR